MWEPVTQALSEGIRRYRIKDEKGELSFKSWIECISTSEMLAISFNEILKKSPFQAYFWEVRPVTKEELGTVFEFVLVESSALTKINANASAFQQYFTEGEEVVHFSNLGGDAYLVVPTDRNKTMRYGHIADFVRHAPSNQIIKFWQTVGTQMANHVGQSPQWLSTAGLGVHWLHIRIDSRPKYYRYAPYKMFKKQ